MTLIHFNSSREKEEEEKKDKLIGRFNEKVSSFYFSLNKNTIKLSEINENILWHSVDKGFIFPKKYKINLNKVVETNTYAHTYKPRTKQYKTKKNCRMVSMKQKDEIDREKEDALKKTIKTPSTMTKRWEIKRNACI